MFVLADLYFGLSFVFWGCVSMPANQYHMSNRYRKPPIIEALCEFRFEPTAEWDLTAPGLIYEQLRDTFPERRKAINVDFNVVSRSGRIQNTLTPTERVQFVREDGSVIVQVSPHFLAINHLAPYSSWEEFKPLIHQTLDAYSAVLGRQQLRTMGLRYINHIALPEDEIHIRDYFEFYPHYGDNLPTPFRHFIIGIQIAFDETDILKVEMTGARVMPEQTSGVVLDLDYSLAKPGAIQIADVSSWIDRAHERIENGFESCIRDSLRARFERIGS